MPNKKITAFNNNDNPTLEDVFPIINNGETKKMSLSGLTNFILPTIDVNTTGGTYSNGITTFINNTGGTFTVSGYTTPFTGGTVNGLTATTISATTYLNLPIIDVFVTGSYSELTALVNSSGLTVGNRYILNDYKTIYQINGSNSRDRTQTYPIVGSAGAYSRFNNVPSTIAADGDTVLCVYAPVGASISAGTYLSIVDYFNIGYISFNPQLTGSNNIGVQIEFSKPRYPNIPSNIVINDITGKPVLKPYGVLNTEVHDGTQYMSMSASENTAPKTETLILTAIATNAFSRDAESITYPGDKLTYDFTNNKIYDENLTQIGTRNGFILRRTNLNESISINYDWREQKFRRYQLDDTNWNGIILNKSGSGLSGTSGSTIYSMGGINYCTVTNPTISNNHKYLLSEPYIANFYTDLAKTVADPFISGTTSVPTVDIGERFNSVSPSIYNVDVSLPLYIFSGLTVTGTTLAKDFTIIPLLNNYPTSNVSTVKINSLTDTVFLDNSNRYGNSARIFVNSMNGTLSNSTFTTSANIVNYGTLINIKSLESMSISNYNYISNLVLMANGGLINYGRIFNSTFGNGYIGASVNEFSTYFVSSTSIILNSIFGGNRIDTFTFNNFNVNSSIFINKTSGVSTMSGKMYLTQYKNNATTYGSEIKLNTFVNQKPNKGYYGYVYDFGTNLYDLELNNFNYNKNLTYENIDASGTTSIVLVVSGK